MRKQQSGVMLLEALIGILIFSMGILAIVGLQATSVKLSGDAQYRSEASLLANELIGQMWASDRTATTFAANFAGGGSVGASSTSGGALYSAWLTRVGTILPGVTTPTLTGTAPPPLVTVTAAVGAFGIATNSVSITLFWQAPNDPNIHQYVAAVQIDS